MAFRNIALFGAGGTNIGYHILQALIADGTFNITVVARQSSKTEHPASVRVVKVADDLPYDELVNAFHGQEVVICATGYSAHPAHYKLIDAAVQAGVQRFIPSEWGFDNGDVKNQELNPIFKGKAEVEAYLRSKESDTFSWTAVATSIWLEWAVNAKFVGVDLTTQTVQYWNHGTHRFSSTTLPYSAQGTLQILKHPEVAKNKRIFVSAFEASQQNIVAELERQQKVKYSVSQVDGDQLVRESKDKWNNQQDFKALYDLVEAAILLPEYKANFVSSGKQPILEDMVEMPKLTLEDVVKELVGANPLNGAIKS